MAAQFLFELKRTHSCGELRASDVGHEVVLMGWVHNRRDHGGAVFIDLRDRGGLTQVKFAADIDTQAHALAGELRSEFCIGVRGPSDVSGEFYLCHSVAVAQIDEDRAAVIAAIGDPAH